MFERQVDGVFARPMYAGNAIATAEASTTLSPEHYNDFS
jgi:hypothetical protein